MSASDLYYKNTMGGERGRRYQNHDIVNNNSNSDNNNNVNTNDTTNSNNAAAGTRATTTTNENDNTKYNNQNNDNNHVNAQLQETNSCTHKRSSTKRNEATNYINDGVAVVDRDHHHHRNGSTSSHNNTDNVNDHSTLYATTNNNDNNQRSLVQNDTIYHDNRKNEASAASAIITTTVSSATQIPSSVFVNDETCYASYVGSSYSTRSMGHDSIIIVPCAVVDENNNIIIPQQEEVVETPPQRQQSRNDESSSIPNSYNPYNINNNILSIESSTPSATSLPPSFPTSSLLRQQHPQEQQSTIQSNQIARAADIATKDTNNTLNNASVISGSGNQEASSSALMNSTNHTTTTTTTTTTPINNFPHLDDNMIKMMIPSKDIRDIVNQYQPIQSFTNEQKYILREKGNFTSGLCEQLLSTIQLYPLRIWLIDNSGSMMTPDGNRFITINNNDIQQQNNNRTSKHNKSKSTSSISKLIPSTSNWVASLSSSSSSMESNNNMMSGPSSSSSLSSNFVQQVSCTRWKELQTTLEFHTWFAGTFNTPTLLHFMNDPEFGNQQQQAAPNQQQQNQHQREILIKHESDIPNAYHMLKNIQPHGTTPLTKHIQMIYNHVYNIQDILYEKKQKVVIVIATDGIPTNEYGQATAEVHEEFVTSLKQLQLLPIWIIIRLCTDNIKIISYYRNLDIDLELYIDVLDDYVNEAKRISNINVWLNYTNSLHRIREFGYHNRIYDLLNERLLSKDELYDWICNILFTNMNTNRNSNSDSSSSDLHNINNMMTNHDSASSSNSGNMLRLHNSDENVVGVSHSNDDDKTNDENENRSIDLIHNNNNNNIDYDNNDYDILLHTPNGWKVFLSRIQFSSISEGKWYNPITKQMDYMIDIKKLHKCYNNNKKNGCCNNKKQKNHIIISNNNHIHDLSSSSGGGSFRKRFSNLFSHK